jgi:hypothetical protein
MTRHHLACALGITTTLLAAPLVADAGEPTPSAPAAETPAAPSAPAPDVEVSPPSAPTPPSDDSIRVKYDKGLSFSSEDGNFEMKLALRSQFRVETTRPLEEGAEEISRMYIPRARLQLEGHVLGPARRYKVEFGLGDKQGFAFLKDLYIEQVVSRGKVHVRAGQWKMPFNRQELVSDFASEFNERANTAEFVEGGRDVGMMLHNDFEKSPTGLEWALGIFNSFKGGTDRPAITTKCSTDSMGDQTCTSKADGASPGNMGPAVVARVGWNLGKIKGYSEGDLEGGPLRLAIGASYKVDLATPEGAEVAHAAGVDVMLKVSGFGLLGGAFMVKKGDADPGYGANVQAGYFISPRRLQLVGRFSLVPNKVDPERNDLEARIAVNRYVVGHQWKMISDFGMLKTTGRDAMGVRDKADLNLRMMAQLTF